LRADQVALHAGEEERRRRQLPRVFFEETAERGTEVAEAVARKRAEATAAVRGEQIDEDPMRVGEAGGNARFDLETRVGERARRMPHGLGDRRRDRRRAAAGVERAAQPAYVDALGLGGDARQNVGVARMRAAQKIE